MAAGSPRRWWEWGRGAVPALLLHVNLLLLLYAGAGLATAARLKWDPSTYVAVRQLLPAEYRVAAVTLCAAAAALLLLAHLAALALTRRARATPLLLTYAACMCAVMVGEAAWAAWTGARVLHALRGPTQEARDLAADLYSVLSFLVQFGLVPADVLDIIDEVEADVVNSVVVCVCSGTVLGVLQVCAVCAALLLARAPPPRAPRTPRAPATPQ